MGAATFNGECGLGKQELDTMDTRQIIELLERIDAELDAELAQARAELDEAENLAVAV